MSDSIAYAGLNDTEIAALREQALADLRAQYTAAALTPRSSPRRDLPTYGDVIAVLESLPVIVRETRRRKGLSLREACGELGISASTLMRWESGTSAPDTPAIIRILRWAA